MKRVVLVRTQGPRNLGMVLRATANFGPAELVLVAPARRAILIHPEFAQMAHGVEQARERVRVVATLDEALSDCTSSVAFTARPRGRARVDWRAVQDEVAGWCREPAQRVALVFGSEENGLTTEEVERCRTIVSVGTSDEHTSINLAMAVGIVLSALFEKSSLQRREGTRHLVRGEDLAYLKEHAKRVLGRAARGPAAQRDIVDSIERVFTRAPIESRDARAWHKVLRALGDDSAPGDLGVRGPVRRLRRSQALERAHTPPEQRDAVPPELRDGFPPDESLADPALPDERGSAADGRTVR